MGKKTQLKKDSPEYFKILSAIWMISNTEECPLILYKQLYISLKISESIDLKGIIQDNREFFKHGSNQKELDIMKTIWKRDGLNPDYLKTSQKSEEVNNNIDKIGTDDVFKSYFRISGCNEKTSIEIINWGVNHIDKLQQAIKDKKKYMIFRFSAILLPLFTMIFSMSIHLLTSYNQQRLMNYNLTLKKIEQGSLHSNMIINDIYSNVIDLNNNILSIDSLTFYKKVSEIEKNLFYLIPFSATVSVSEIENELKKYKEIGFRLLSDKSIRSSDSTKFLINLMEENKKIITGFLIKNLDTIDIKK